MRCRAQCRKRPVRWTHPVGSPAGQSATTRRAGSLRKAPRGGLLRQAPHAIPPRTRRYPLASGSFLTTHCGPISTAPVISALGSRFWRFAKWKHSATQHRPNKTIRLHDGTAEPCRVTPPEAVVYYVNYPVESPVPACREQIKVLARLTSSCSRLVDSIFKSAADDDR